MAITTFIYSLNCPLTNTPKYIGKANDLKERYKGHLKESMLNRGATIKNNWLKSLKNKGLKPVIEKIDEVPINEWQFWERHYISLYKSWGFKLKNATDGGEQVTMTEEIKQKMRLAKLGTISNAKGTRHSEQAKEKNRLAHIGKNTGAEHKRSRAIIQIDIKTGKELREFVNITEAGRFVGKRTSINNVLCGWSKTACGFKWKYK